MKLILGSDISFLLEYGYNLTGIPKDKMKIGYVTTASKGGRDKSFIENVKNIIRENSYPIEEIDIEGKTETQIGDFFADKNIIHVEGGNTFYLLRAIRQTGFDKILKEQIERGKVYIGTSAGAYIMCPTIEVADWNENGRDRYGITDFTALSYVPFFIKAHYKDEAKEKVKEKMKDLRYPLRLLKDGQGIVVEDGHVTFLGNDKEARL